MGEDPYLASIMVVPYIHGVQRNGVAACVKHFALNNQEIDREYVNVIVDDRALHEIYLPAFKAAVQKGGTWSIMGAYNKYKNQFCCHNQYLLNDILKRDWGSTALSYLTGAEPMTPIRLHTMASTWRWEPGPMDWLGAGATLTTNISWPNHF